MSSAFDLTKYANLTRANLRFMAKAAETAERYEDMCKCMKKLVIDCKDATLDVEERNLLSVAYKNVIGARRATWRTLNVQLSSKDSADADNKPLIGVYKAQVERELKDICDEVLDLLLKYLVKATPVDSGLDKEAMVKEYESRVFYLKMTADYYRYLVEFSDTVENKSQAKKYYDDALAIASEQLPPTHPIRLGLALNYSVCYYEILKDSKKACLLAKTAFDQAIQQLDQLDEASYKDSTLIMQLLRDNLTLWTNDASKDETGGDKDIQVEDVQDGDQ